MRKTIKLTFAALALTALASCSGDDLLGNGNNPLKQDKKGVVVEVEDMIDPMTTRAAWIPDATQGGLVQWQNEDQLWVFDNSLTMWDKYFYNSEEGGWAPAEGDDVVPNPLLYCSNTTMELQRKFKKECMVLDGSITPRPARLYIPFLLS